MADIALPQAARDLLESDAVAHVVTLDEDGGPQVTAARVGLDGDEIVFATFAGPGEAQELPPGYVTKITLERLGGVGPWNPPHR